MGSSDTRGFEEVKSKRPDLATWRLRPADWTGPVLPLDEIDKYIKDKAHTKVLFATLVKDEEDASFAQALMGQCCKDSCAMLVRRSKEEGSRRVPGLLGARLHFQFVSTAHAGPDHAKVDPKTKVSLKFAERTPAQVQAKVETEVIKFVAKKA